VIRFFFRWAFRFLVLGIVLAVALVLLKDVLAKAAAEYQIRRQTGMDVNIGSLELGLFSPTLTLSDLKLYNAPEFGGSPFLDVPDLHIKYRPGPLARGKLHLDFVRIALTEVNVVEGRDGRTNIVLAIDGLEPRAAQPHRPDSLLGWEFVGVDTLNLSLGRLRYSSLRRPGKATELKVGLKNEVLTNMKSFDEIRELVLKRIFRNGITITGGGRGGSFR
jgi:uncharacterized protein involved in outer membrane biogenesis